MSEDKIFLELLKVMEDDEVELVCSLLSTNKEEILNSLVVELLKKYRDFIPSLRKNSFSY